MKSEFGKKQSATRREKRPANNSADSPISNSFHDVLSLRLKRRSFMKGVAAVSVPAIAGIVESAPANVPDKNPASIQSRFEFTEIDAKISEDHEVAPEFEANILISWGDPLSDSTPEFDPLNQTSKAQAMQFGYNNDFTGFLPFIDNENNALLVVNHEYTNEELMFPGMVRQDKAQNFSAVTKDLVDIEMMAHGGTVIEIERLGNQWKAVKNSVFNRRITATTKIAISGPCAGHPRMLTSYDANGTSVFGMINNCGGGITPWRTWLSCEENINGYFWNKQALRGHREQQNLERMGIPGEWYNWGAYYDRFDIAKEPNESNRFGWVVEIDPFDPLSTPIKRTALGRFKHECAASVINDDGRVVLYMGDDQKFEYVYKFVTRDVYDKDKLEKNKNILDYGVLYAAKFDNSGSLKWLPLVFGVGPLNRENHFYSQADVLIETRRAADLLGATRMDRPEDVQVNRTNGKVYVLLTNNNERLSGETDASNPRPINEFGHILEITSDSGNHGSRSASWDILTKCGNPELPSIQSTFHPETTRNGWFGMPDNGAVDGQGRLWIATDGNGVQTTGRNDGLWALETEGEQRAKGKHFYRCPIGAELCGPSFAANDTALFVSVQHPGQNSNYNFPSTRWPDFGKGPPRPSVVCITRKNGDRI